MNTHWYLVKYALEVVFNYSALAERTLTVTGKSYYNLPCQEPECGAGPRTPYPSVQKRVQEYIAELNILIPCTRGKFAMLTGLVANKPYLQGRF
jgi:hypothetical protein